MNVLLKCKTFCNNLHIFSTNLQSVNVKHPVEVVDFVLESSTMWCSDWGVVSYPCRNKKYDHAGDRKVSSCLLVTLKK